MLVSARHKEKFGKGFKVILKCKKQNNIRDEKQNKFSLGTKNKINFFVRMKTFNLIL